MVFFRTCFSIFRFFLNGLLLQITTTVPRFHVLFVFLFSRLNSAAMPTFVVFCCFAVSRRIAIEMKVVESSFYRKKALKKIVVLALNAAATLLFATAVSVVRFS